MMKYVSIIGDCHGKFDKLIQLANESEYSICLGDVGFDYSPLDKLSPKAFKVLGGNHDNYSKNTRGDFYLQTEHFLGDFGVHKIPDFPDIFFVRGGFSVDKESRTMGLDWWPDEEMNYMRCCEVMDMYKDVKPNFMISHECPAFLVPEFSTWKVKTFFGSRTAKLLEQMWEFHKPKIHLFGHHHMDKQITFKDTQFICLNELSVMDFPKGFTP